MAFCLFLVILVILFALFHVVLHCFGQKDSDCIKANMNRSTLCPVGVSFFLLSTLSITPTMLCNNQALKNYAESLKPEIKLRDLGCS